MGLDCCKIMAFGHRDLVRTLLRRHFHRSSARDSRLNTVPLVSGFGREVLTGRVPRGLLMGSHTGDSACTKPAP
jgi:hypothetical protein